MQTFFYPESIVIVGVSSSSFNLANIVMMNNLKLGFSGDIFGVGTAPDPTLEKIVYKHIEELPKVVDLAVLLTPARTIPSLMRSCGQKGIRRVVIESAGFTEFSEDGTLLAQEIKAIAREFDMRFVGPNCIGTINTRTNLFLPFGPIESLGVSGTISLIAQSGGVGSHYFMRMKEEGIGLSKSVSVGNKMDLDELDFLEYYEGDPETRAVGLYLESISRGRELFELACHSTKPWVFHKSNRSAGATSIARSHTAALSADDSIVDVALQQSGMIRVNTGNDLLNVLKVFELPLMKGNRVAILSRSGGHAVITVDACLNHGFEINPFPDDFFEALQEIYTSRVITQQNPLDLGEIFDYPLFARIVELALSLENIDGIIFNHLYIPGIETPGSRIFLAEVKALQQKYEKPVVVTMATEMKEFIDTAREVGFPIYLEPADAVNALAHSRNFARVKMKKDITREHSGSRSRRKVDWQGASFLNVDKGLSYLNSLDLPVAPFSVFSSRKELRQKAGALGYPLALKILSEKALHKTDVGGVIHSIQTEEQLIEAYENMKTAFLPLAQGESPAQFLLQKMIHGGQEFFIGARRDPLFGPLIVAGLGGIFVETLKDTAIRLAPITPAEAKEMLTELKSYAIIKGTRAQKSLDSDFFAQAIATISAVIADDETIAEIDINPIMLFQEKGVIVDTRFIKRED